MKSLLLLIFSEKEKDQAKDTICLNVLFIAVVGLIMLFCFFPITMTTIYGSIYSIIALGLIFIFRKEIKSKLKYSFFMSLVFRYYLAYVFLSWIHRLKK
ncbi:MAG: hypothetical protein ABH951_01995 [Patescibacteria group bacterium]